MQSEVRLEVKGVAIAKGLNKQACDQVDVVQMSYSVGRISVGLMTEFHLKHSDYVKGH